ncbi:hypothetical protein LshimejAT787_0804960 [Lyophyllum shimeji]|uniref:Uncharacterized protein n=1 Tax=Lyophyllum shimeji TaxID=47721 RepID=A0A9P3PRF0_LYOSH|nr:hypothetical protein LshimejAT787_0804960 [Lyophyllum shimeji]
MYSTRAASGSRPLIPPASAGLRTSPAGLRAHPAGLLVPPPSDPGFAAHRCATSTAHYYTVFTRYCTVLPSHPIVVHTVRAPGKGSLDLFSWDLPLPASCESASVQGSPLYRKGIQIDNGEAPEKLDSIADLEDWINSISRLHQAIKAKMARDRKAYIAQLVALENEAKRFRQNVANVAATSTPASAIPSSNATNTSVMDPIFAYKYAKKLTVNERELLKKNDGCTGCRKPFVGSKHACEYKNKPLPFNLTPNVTQAYIDKCRGAKATQIAAVFEEVEESSDDDEEDEEFDHANEYLFPRHLSWSCLISAPSIALTAMDGLLTMAHRQL